MNGELKDCKSTQVQGSRSGMSVSCLQYMFGCDDLLCCEFVSDKRAEVLCVSDKKRYERCKNFESVTIL